MTTTLNQRIENNTANCRRVESLMADLSKKYDFDVLRSGSGEDAQAYEALMNEWHTLQRERESIKQEIFLSNELYS